MNFAALIPAAGSGTRLGMGYKALVTLGGKTLLQRAIDNLTPHVKRVYVALPEDLAVWDSLKHNTSAIWVTGGQTRQDSVCNLLRACDTEGVLIHDAARPFLPSRVIQEVQNAVIHHHAATAALPCADTLVHSTDGTWQGLVNRNETFAVQTPQGFVRQLLLDAHVKAVQDNYQATDDAGLIVRYGGAVHLVPGDSRLFKITVQSDLELAEAYCPIWETS